MLQHGKVQVGEFNLSVAADRLPPAYSQLSSDVPLPNLKWIDGHKSVFKVNVSMVSSIHPKVRECEEGRRERGEEGGGGKGRRGRGEGERRGGEKGRKEEGEGEFMLQFGDAQHLIGPSLSPGRAPSGVHEPVLQPSLSVGQSGGGACPRCLHLSSFGSKPRTSCPVPAHHSQQPCLPPHSTNRHRGIRSAHCLPCLICPTLNTDILLLDSLPSSSSLLLPPLSPLLPADTPAKAFKAIAHIVKTVHDLWLPADKHNRNLILASYMQYVFTAPQSQYSSGSFDARTATLMKGQRRPGSIGEDDHSAYAHALRKGGSLRAARTKEIHFSGELNLDRYSRLSGANLYSGENCVSTS